VLPNPLPDKKSRDGTSFAGYVYGFHSSADSARVALDGLGYRRSRWRRRRLGLKRTTLIAKMKKLGISRPAQQTETIDLTENGEEVPTGT